MISFNNEINLKVIESLGFEADIFFTDIEIRNSNDNILLRTLSDLNNQIQEDLINENRQYDFKVRGVDNVYEITSLLGNKINLKENILEEITNIVEKPKVLICEFDKRFLNIPKEIWSEKLGWKISQYVNIRTENGKIIIENNNNENSA